MFAGISRFILVYALLTGALLGEEFGLAPKETYSLKQELGEKVFFLDYSESFNVSL